MTAQEPGASREHARGLATDRWGRRRGVAASSAKHTSPATPLSMSRPCERYDGRPITNNVRTSSGWALASVEIGRSRSLARANRLFPPKEFAELFRSEISWNTVAEFAEPRSVAPSHDSGQFVDRLA
jgi:hypothetical protein